MDEPNQTQEQQTQQPTALNIPNIGEQTLELPCLAIKIVEQCQGVTTREFTLESKGINTPECASGIQYLLEAYEQKLKGLLEVKKPGQ